MPISWETNLTGNPVLDKKRLRTRMSAIREMLGAEGRANIDAKIAENVRAHPAYQEADTVFTYLSSGSEVDTRALIKDAWEHGKTVAIPRVVPGTRLMEWYRIEDFASLEAGSFGIEEPPANPDNLVVPPEAGSGSQADAGPGSGSSEAAANAKAVALVPGFSFDRQGYRVGYGGGFYDTFLATFGGASIGLCRHQQISDDPIPRDEHDLPVQFVVTD